MDLEGIDREDLLGDLEDVPSDVVFQNMDRMRGEVEQKNNKGSVRKRVRSLDRHQKETFGSECWDFLKKVKLTGRTVCLHVCL